MAVHHSRRRGPLPADIEFSSLDSIASGHSLVELALLDKGKQRAYGGGGGGGDQRTVAGDVEIVPLIKLGKIDGLDGPHITYGPFNPPQKTSVPLWLALHLKKKRKCRIVCPGWLNLPYLESQLKEEQTNEVFSDLPRDYLEVSKILLDVASDDIASTSTANTPDRLRLVLKDIREARQSKIREGLGAINSVHLGMPNLSSMEINELRPFFAQAFVRLSQLDPMADEYKEREMEWLRNPEKLQEEMRLGIGLGARRGDREESGMGF
ncbi:DNA replication protein PSF2 [Sporobolomyces salmoneus]|uniref:DNA replication protein PSF2 n=1 Tax=Sporobolomyces salmoneus TaxID=183962 RepID=UPI00316BD6D2